MAYSFRPRISVCCVAFFLISGCATQFLRGLPQRVPVYAGPLRSIDEVGVFLSVQLVQLNRVDGVDVSDFKRPEIPFGRGWEIELLPGMHKLEYDYVLNTPNISARSVSSQTRMIKVEAGHIYMARDANNQSGHWDVQVIDVTEKERTNLAARRSAAPNN